MKIVIVVHYFLPHVGGMEVVVEKQAKSLVKRGHKVTILTCRPTKNAPSMEERDGYIIKRIPALNFVENRFGVTFPIIGPWELLRFISELRQSDVVHLHDVFYMSSHLAAFASMVLGKPFFLTQHVAMVDHPNTLVMSVQKIVYATLGKMLFFRAKKIVTYNHTVQQFLSSRGVKQSKILTHYNGIDTMYFMPKNETEKRKLREKYNLPANRPIVLFVGRLVAKKGFEIVYQAHSEKYFTLIVGGSVGPVQVKSSENVRLYGTASPGELRDLYALSDVFAFPAVGEIFTLVMQEAMASGLPIVVADDPGYEPYGFSREHIRLVARNSDALRESLEHIVRNHEQCTAMASYARKFAVENFDWERNYKKEYEIYEDVQKIGAL